jgi:DNA-binding NarL/FixJ family response regulator
MTQEAPFSVESKPKHISVVDTDTSIHNAIGRALEEHGWIMSSHMNAVVNPQSILRTHPDAILMDCSIPVIGTVALIRKVKKLLPEIPIMIFSSRYGTEEVLNSVLAGACGYLIKPVSPSDVVFALEKIMSGLVIFDLEAEKQLLDGLHCLGKTIGISPLSPREREIMVEIADYKSDKEIAEKFHISTGTVHVLLARIFGKMGAHSREEALQKILWRAVCL